MFYQKPPFSEVLPLHLRKRRSKYQPPYLALVAHAVTQAIGGMELEDGLRTVRRPTRLHGHCGVCISPTVMLNPLWGMAWLWGWGRGHNSHAKT